MFAKRRLDGIEYYAKQRTAKIKRYRLENIMKRQSYTAGWLNHTSTQWVMKSQMLQMVI